MQKKTRIDIIKTTPNTPDNSGEESGSESEEQPKMELFFGRLTPYVKFMTPADVLRDMQNECSNKIAWTQADIFSRSSCGPNGFCYNCKFNIGTARWWFMQSEDQRKLYDIENMFEELYAENNKYKKMWKHLRGLQEAMKDLR